MQNVQLAPGFVIQQQGEVQSEERCKEAIFDASAEVQPGMADGDVITFPRMSEQRPHQIPGDVKLRIQVGSHPRFRRDGSDLSTDLTISLRQARPAPSAHTHPT